MWKAWASFGSLVNLEGKAKHFLMEFAQWKVVYVSLWKQHGLFC